jgi:hypothetical protein
LVTELTNSVVRDLAPTSDPDGSGKGSREPKASDTAAAMRRAGKVNS